jgi:hypothetical protein
MWIFSSNFNIHSHHFKAEQIADWLKDAFLLTITVYVKLLLSIFYVCFVALQDG